MKIKSLFSASILVISATACTSDEVLLTPETAETSIRFNAVTNNMTRAAHSFCASEQPKQFFVAAFLGSKNYFNQTEIDYYDTINYSASSWTNDNKRNWPKHDALDFYAFLDGGETLADRPTFTADEDVSNAFEVNINEYTVGSTVANQRDLMYAVTKGAKQSDDGGTVTLNFRHALSQICFQAENEDADNEYIITSITVSGVNGTGTFNFGNVSTADGTDGGSWSNQSGAVNYSVINSESVSDGLQLNRKGNNNDGMDHINISNLSGMNHTGESITEYEILRSRALNLIPQTISSEGAQITVIFKVKGNNNEETVNIPLKDTTWELGKRYIYNLKFTACGLIKYDISIADFISDNDETDNSKDKIYDNVLY